MLFLGHWISKGVIQIDPEKIRVWTRKCRRRREQAAVVRMLEAIDDTTRQLRRSRKLPQPR